MFEYVKSTRATGRPLTLAGFDIQRSGLRADFDRPAQLRQAVGVFDPVLAEEAFALDREWVEAPDLTGYATANADRAPIVRLPFQGRRVVGERSSRKR